ncbi:ATP-binding protein [Streptomyces sp. B22F1]|uniref:ATP-binding protein n=1 Tax=Streptomyces sp. B22F1 TaxID=3153566 RepID=UPI00325D5C8B
MDPPAPDGGNRLAGKRQFARRARAVGRARDFVASLLDPDVDAKTADDIRLCVSELATNAVRYGPRGRDFLVRVATRDDAVRIEVHDAGDGPPRLCTPGRDDCHGRGLHVVAALADEWGVSERTGPGKAVWAEFRVGG